MRNKIPSFFFFSFFFKGVGWGGGWGWGWGWGVIWCFLVQFLKERWYDNGV